VAGNQLKDLTLEAFTADNPKMLFQLQLEMAVPEGDGPGWPRPSSYCLLRRQL